MVTLVALVVLTTVTAVCKCDHGAHLLTSVARFVEDVPNYPDDAIRQALLRALPKPESVGGNARTEFSKGTASESGGGGGTRDESAEQPSVVSKVFGCVGVANQNSDLEFPPCETNVQELKPRQGPAADGQNRLIVNDPLYEQKIYTQVCKYEGKPCDTIEADLRSGYQSICLQSYTEVELLTFRNDSQNNLLKTEVFQLPVSCDCYLQSYLFN